MLGVSSHPIVEGATVTTTFDGIAAGDSLTETLLNSFEVEIREVHIAPAENVDR
jgi:hypothetical protein